MKKLITLLFLSQAVIACTSKQKVLDANWVSMKYSELPDESKLVSVAPIEAKYCMNSWSGTYGLMDEAIKKAESFYQIDFIKSPSFIQEGEHCMTVYGEGYRKK